METVKRKPSEVLALICAIADQASAHAAILESTKPGTLPDSEDEYKMMLVDLKCVSNLLFGDRVLGTYDDTEYELEQWANRLDSIFDDYFVL